MAYFTTTAGYLLNDKMEIVTNDVKAVLKAPDNDALAEKKLKDVLAQEHDIIKCLNEIKFLFTDSESNVAELEKLADRLIKDAKSICEPGKAKEMDEFFLDMFNTFMGTVPKSVADICSNIRDYPIPRSQGQFTQSQSYLCPAYKSDMNDNSSYVFDAGEDVIQKIIKRLVMKRSHNILFSNLEYMTGIAQGVRHLEDGTENSIPQRLYATYRSGDGDLIDAEVRKLFAKVAIGPSDSYRFQNKSLDVAIHRFTQLLKYHDEYRTTEVVKPSNTNKDLSRIGRYMREGGLVLVAVPDFMWRTKEIVAIRSNFRLLWSVNLENDIKNSQYTLVAFRYTRNMTDEEKEANFSALMNLTPVNEVTEEMLDAAVKELPPNDFGELRQVTGSVMDKAILDIVLQESTIHGIFVEPKKSIIHPPLPLKKGQIGQMIASGKLDGIINEGNGFKHVIRGRVYKGTIETREVDYDDPDNAVETTTKTNNNLIEINVFCGDGTYKRIAVAE